MSDWRAAGTIERFPEDEPVGVEFEVGDRRLNLAVIRRGDTCHAVVDQCPHRGAPFSELGLVDDEGHLVCGWHFWSFRLSDGCHTLIPDVRVCAYATKVEEGQLLVDVEAPR